MFDDPVIDVREFAKSGGRLAGTVAAVRLARLFDLLTDDSGSVSYDLAGRLDDDGNPRLQIDVAGRFSVRCQRCLGPVPQVIASRRELRFLSDASLLPEVADEAPDVDDLPMPAAMRVLDWVEDEILLGLPISPRHDEGGCRPPPNPAAEPDAVGDKPFAQLAGLRFPNTKDQ
jgi:uncharacterized protein